jgi:hypothetical protein
MTTSNDKLDSNEDDILEKEIESWKSFEYALREENAILFNKMLEEIRECSKAIAVKGQDYSAESLLMALVFQQQKMISHLISKLCKDNNNKKDNNSKRQPLVFLNEFDERKKDNFPMR